MSKNLKYKILDYYIESIIYNNNNFINVFNRK